MASAIRRSCGQCARFRGTSLFLRNLIEAAYEDRPLDIGYRRDDLSALHRCGDVRVARSLERRTACSRLAQGRVIRSAILAELAGKVFSIEVVPQIGCMRAAQRWIVLDITMFMCDMAMDI